MENYFNAMMEEGCRILTASRISWPMDLNAQQKVTLLEKHLEYFNEQEQYEKCAELKKKINRITKIKSH